MDPSKHLNISFKINFQMQQTNHIVTRINKSRQIYYHRTQGPIYSQPSLSELITSHNNTANQKLPERSLLISQVNNNTFHNILIHRHPAQRSTFPFP